VQKQLDSLPAREFARVDRVILSLETNPRPHGCKKLKGRQGWRLRVGDYRIVFEVNDREKQVLLLDVVHRREVYR
jgi:mRNA interferase RelE/StbE